MQFALLMSFFAPLLPSSATADCSIARHGEAAMQETLQARDTDAIGVSIRTLLAFDLPGQGRIFSQAPASAFIAFTNGAGLESDNATTPNALTAQPPNPCFHELGVFGIEGGPIEFRMVGDALSIKDGPARASVSSLRPDYQARAAEVLAWLNTHHPELARSHWVHRYARCDEHSNNWALLQHESTVRAFRRALLHSTSGSWRQIGAQAPIGLVNLKHHQEKVRDALIAKSRLLQQFPTQSALGLAAHCGNLPNPICAQAYQELAAFESGSLLGVALAFSAWSTGAEATALSVLARDLTDFRPIGLRTGTDARVLLPEPELFAAWVRHMSQHPRIGAFGRHGNPAYTLLRTLQKLEAGRQLSERRVRAHRADPGELEWYGVLNDPRFREILYPALEHRACR